MNQFMFNVRVKQSFQGFVEDGLVYQFIDPRHQVFVVLLQQGEQLPLVDEGHVQVGLDQLRRVNQRLLDLVDQRLMDELREVEQGLVDVDQRLMNYLRDVEDWLMDNVLQRLMNV